MGDEHPHGSDMAGQDEAYGKKRPLDGPPTEDGAASKRAHVEGDKVYAMKMMTSNKDAGTIIGRAGATIKKLQEVSGSRIRVSNAQEYFPGTGDRVVLLTGPLESIVSGCSAVLNELFRDSESYQQVAASGEMGDTLTVNLLIPDLSSGHIIGKGGENIRRMVEESGAKIQLTAKEKQAPGTNERILSLIGSLQQVVRATELVVSKVWEDPKCQYVNTTTNYKSAYGGGGGMGPRGGPPGGGYGGPPMGYGGGGGYDMYSSAYPPPDPYYHQPPPYDSYGPPGYGGPARPPPGGHGPPPGYGGAPPRGGGGGYDAYGGGGGGGGGGPAGGGAALNSVSYQLHVPDHVVPAVLGRGGQVIKEMMDQSGAVIKVSQKGDYVPGTSNRIITITGSQNAASFAHQLVSAKIPLS